MKHDFKSALRQIMGLPYAEVKSDSITIHLPKGQAGLKILGKLDAMEHHFGIPVHYISTIVDPATAYIRRRRGE